MSRRPLERKTLKSLRRAVPSEARAAIGVLKELGLYEEASAGCIAMLSDIIDRETAASDMLRALRPFSAWANDPTLKPTLEDCELARDAVARAEEKPV